MPKLQPKQLYINEMIYRMTYNFFYPRPVLAIGYCHRLRLRVRLCVCPCVYQSRAWPSDNPSTAHERITKFRPSVRNTLVKIPIVLGGD